MTEVEISRILSANCSVKEFLKPSTFHSWLGVEGEDDTMKSTNNCRQTAPDPSLLSLSSQLKQTWDQFPRQASKLCQSHLAQSIFFLWGMTTTSGKDTTTPGSQLSHWEDLLSVLRRQCWHEVHTSTDAHTQPRWRRHVVRLSRGGWKRVCISTTASHVQSRKCVIICTRTEKTEIPRLQICSTFPRVAAGSRPLRLHINFCCNWTLKLWASMRISIEIKVVLTVLGE